jgi:hypothetical protein
MKKSLLRSKIRAMAVSVLKKYPQDKGVARQVLALVSSLDDTLSDRRVLEELTALKASGRPFQEVFASLTRES